MKFLIVDDDKDNNMELHLALSEFGISDIVTTEKHAMSLLNQSLQQEMYKAVFAGLELPDNKTGIALARAMRSLGLGEYSQTLTVLMTDSDEMTVVLNKLSKKDVVFIKKPIDKKAVSQMIQKITVKKD